MKRLFTYISTALFGCLLFTSCSQDADTVGYVNDSTNAFVELQLFMPSTDYNSSRAPVQPEKNQRPSTSEGGKENGTAYENKIVGKDDISIFVFDLKKGAYLGRVNQFTFDPVPGNPRYSFIKGELPAKTIGHPLRLVFMMNYKSRGVTLKAPKNQKFSQWLPVNDFLFPVQKVWLPSDETAGHYIPMSGEYLISDPVKAGDTSHGAIELQRAVAKVRVTAGDNVTIESIKVVGAQRIGYALPQTVISQNTSQALNETLVPNSKLTKGQSVYFYLPEQKKNSTYLSVKFLGDAEPKKVEFKNYEMDLNNPGNTDFYTWDIERNCLYDYIISSKGGGGMDIRGNALDWAWYELNTDFE